MKKPLRALFYGQTHEHAPGKLETLKKLRDEFEIVAVVDDFPRKSPMYRDQAWDNPTKVTRVLRSAFGYPPGGRTDGTALLEFPETTVLIRTACEMPGGILCRRLRVDGTNGTIDLCPIERFDGEELKLVLTLREAAGGHAAGRHEIGFGVQTDRYEGQLRELAAVVRGERPNDQDYDRDLRVHALTLKMCSDKTEINIC